MIHLAKRHLAVLLALLAGAGACSSGPTAGNDAGPSPTASAGAGAGAQTSPPPATAAPLRAPTREGGALTRSVREDALYVADEDHGVVRVVPLPLDPARPGVAVSVPGKPAQVLALDGRVLVTVRDPGLLLVLRPDPAAGLVEAARVALPADAWGIAITPDEKTALVSSAWTHQVSAIDLDAAKTKWTVDTAREPRGITVLPDGSAAYVSHLVGAELTRLDDLAGPPKARRVALPASPLRTPSAQQLGASLGYALALSDDGRRLFAARHALGAMGHAAWFGAATVDVLLTGRDRDEPLAPLHHGNLPVVKSEMAEQVMTPESVITLPGASVNPFTQPRAVAYRKRARSLLVAGEGDDLLAELDATAVDPTLAVLKTYQVGGRYDPHIRVAGTCASPTGLALSTDESTAWVFCRATYDIAAVRLQDPAASPAVAAAASAAPAAGSAVPAAMPVAPAASPTESPVAALVHLADDPLGAEYSMGRRLYYNALDTITSGNLACAGCHPDGRDDGYVWHEATFSTADGEKTNFVGRMENIPEIAKKKGYARRTPMLASNVSARGPYGWHGESEDLITRLEAGMGLHRWGGFPQGSTDTGIDARATLIAQFIRRGLVAPPRADAPLDARQKRGQEIFNSEEAKCARCHVPATEYSDRMAYPMPKRPPLPGFDDDPRPEYKTPSLRFVGGRAPYLHDGRASTLAELVQKNADWMGKTSHLSPEDQAALVAFLETL